MAVKLLALFTLCYATLLPSADGGNFKPFIGTWKGTCADGKDFVIVAFSPAQPGGLTGTVRLANMRGGDDGRCVTVVDPPSDKHALNVTDVKLSGSALTFKGSGRMEFEMRVTEDAASLKFIGTPSEEHPWALKRAR